MQFVRKNILFLVGVSVMLFCVLAIFVSRYPQPALDVRLVQYVQSFGSERTLAIMNLVSVPGNVIPATVLTVAAFIFLMLSPIRAAIIPFLLIIPADLTAFGIKQVIDRPRPSDPTVVVHQALSDPSFPSGHVVHYMVFFGFLTYLFLRTELVPKKFRMPLAYLSLTLICLVPVSRMYLGAHWPTDVTAGLLLGGSILYLQIKVFQRMRATINTNNA